MDPHSLRSCALFSALNDAEVKAVARLAVVEDYNRATKLFSVGDPADSFYLINSGKVRIIVPPSAEEEQKQIILRSPGFFGEIGLVRDCNRTADAFAEAGSSLLRFDKRTFDALMSTDAEIARKVTEAIMDRLGEFRAAHEDDRKDVSEPRTLLFLSPQGKEGASFVAANVAVKLREVTGDPTLAVDMNFGNQGMWRYLETLANLGSYAEIFTCKDITSDVVKRCAAPLDVGVHLLSGFDAEMSDALRPRHAGEIISRGREAFEYVVVDLGTRRDKLAEEAARRSDVVHIVCEATEASIGAADGLADWLRGHGLGDRIRFILNKIPEEPEVDPAVVEKVLGESFLGAVHNSGLQSKRVNQASSPVVLSNPDSQVAAELTSLCCNIQSQPTGPLEKIRNLFMWTIGLD